MTGVHFPRSSLALEQCLADTNAPVNGACNNDDAQDVIVHVGEDGTFSADFTVAAQISTNRGGALGVVADDCRTSVCVLALRTATPRALPIRQPLGFALDSLLAGSPPPVVGAAPPPRTTPRFAG